MKIIGTTGRSDRGVFASAFNRLQKLRETYNSQLPTHFKNQMLCEIDFIKRYK